MTHNDYADSLKKDQEFCEAQAREWESKLKEAALKVEYWKEQGSAMMKVSARARMSKISAFS